MAKGGARNRTGKRLPDPKSARSELRGVRFGKLPRDGYKGDPPKFPLTYSTARERTVWKEVWTTPQAEAWATEPWRWPTIAMYVRARVRFEDKESSAAVGTIMIRLQDQIGLSPAGMRENMWEIEEAPGTRPAAEPEKPEEGKATPTPPAPSSVRDRLKIVQPSA